MTMKGKTLPKVERATIAQHEAGMHDRKANAACRECVKQELEAGSRGG